MKNKNGFYHILILKLAIFVINKKLTEPYKKLCNRSVELLKFILFKKIFDGKFELNTLK